MKCSVFINSDLIDQDDICIFNVHDDEIHFCSAGKAVSYRRKSC